MIVKNVIFDMDGVLVDSEPFFRNKVYRFFKDLGKTIPLNEISKLAGTSDKTTFEMMAKWYGENITPKEIETLYREKTKNVSFSYSDMLNPYVRYILKLLKKDYKLAIASSSSMGLIQKCINECQLDGYFDLIVSGTQFKESKPNPEIYQYVAKQLNSSCEECVVIEDSSVGILAAKRAGMYTLAHSDQRFNFDQSLADYIFVDFLEAYLHIISL